jgi:hypothetical protein
VVWDTTGHLGRTAEVVEYGAPTSGFGPGLIFWVLSRYLPRLMLVGGLIIPTPEWRSRVEAGTSPGKCITVAGERSIYA